MLRPHGFRIASVAFSLFLIVLSKPSLAYDPENSFRIYNHSLERVAGPMGGGIYVLGSFTFDVGVSCATLGWTSYDLTAAPFGNYAGLAKNVLEEDICANNPSCVWTFFIGSASNYGCNLPIPRVGQETVPYGPVGGDYIYNEVRSPDLSLTGTHGDRFELTFDAYVDLDLDALVFYYWRVRSKVGGAYTAWKTNDGIFYGRGRDEANLGDWLTITEDIGALIEPGATDIQVALGVRDRYGDLGGSYGSGSCHSHAPILDNVDVYRVDSAGAQWNVREAYLFHDAFPYDGTAVGKVHANTATGDEVLVETSGYGAPIAVDPYTGVVPAVYCYVAVWPTGQPGKSGSNLSGDPVRFPWVTSILINGTTWDVLRMDVDASVDDGYDFDLNDELFAPGDTICFFFGAEDVNGVRSFWSRYTETTNDINYAAANPMEFTCLPANGQDDQNDILYVDAFDFRGADPLFMDAFQSMSLRPDRYDVRDPSAFLGNGLGNAVVSVIDQLTPFYRKIIWNSGDLPYNGIEDGSATRPSDDTALLKTFLDNLTQPGGVYLSGDHIAAELDSYTSASALLFRSSYIDFAMTSTSHRAQGFPVSPLVVGVLGGCFFNGAVRDSMFAVGGCQPSRDFDVISATGASVVELEFTDGVNMGDALVHKTTVNPNAVNAHVMLATVGVDVVVNAMMFGNADRRAHLHAILSCLENQVPEPVGAQTRGYENSLEQNYPNPFNPVTTITYSIRAAGSVTIYVYDVAGRLVRTLVGPNDTKQAGVHEVPWDGRNDAGARVASGVYFYRIITTEFSSVRKMVVIK